jgi:hypothetical protein
MLRHEISREILLDMMTELEDADDVILDKNYLINRLRWLGHVIEEDQRELEESAHSDAELEECKQRLITKLTKFAEEAMPFYRDAEQLKALMIDIMGEIDNVYRLGRSKGA